MKAGHDIAASLGFFWLVSQQRQPLGRQAQQAQQLRQWGGVARRGTRQPEGQGLHACAQACPASRRLAALPQTHVSPVFQLRQGSHTPPAPTSYPSQLAAHLVLGWGAVHAPAQSGRSPKVRPFLADVIRAHTKQRGCVEGRHGRSSFSVVGRHMAALMP